MEFCLRCLQNGIKHFTAVRVNNIPVCGQHLYKECKEQLKVLKFVKVE